MTPLEAHGRRSWPRARLLLIVAAALIISKQLMAQEARRCFPAASVQQQLAANYQEKPVAIGLTTSGNIFAIWASRDGVTWTAVESSPDGRACIIGTGRNLEILHRNEEGQES